MNDHMLGSLFDGKYKILSFIDKGGMGTIYRAEQLSLNREVALKLMQCPEDPIAEKRFFLEASLCAQLKHPNTIRIFEFGKSDDGHVYIVMELLHGQSMNSYIKTHGGFESQKALNICRKICAALNEAHKNGIIHRDVKPSNIFLHMTEGEIHPKLIDFGLVKEAEHSSELSHTGLIMGSPMFMSPEQVDSQEITYASDIYSLGLTLYTMLSGQSPYQKESMTQIMIAQLREEPKALSKLMPSSHFPEPLEWTIQTATRKAPHHRFDSMSSFRDALDYCLKAIQSGQDIPLNLKNGAVVLADSSSNTQTIDLQSQPELPKVSHSEETAILNPHSSENVALTSGTLLGIKTPHPEHRSIMLKAIGITTIVAIAILTLGWFWMSSSLQKTPEASPATQSQPLPALKSEPQLIEVTLRSDPNHAEVYHNDEFLGNTPFTALLLPDERKSVELRLNGYNSKSITLNALSLSPSVILSPSAIPKVRTAPAAAAAAPTPPAQPATVDSPAPEPVLEDLPDHGIQTKDPWAD